MTHDGSQPDAILESPEEVLTTLRKDGSRRWMYPVQSSGRYLHARRVVGWALIVLFVALPWISISQKPAIFIDLARREFTFFGLTLFATDTVFLMVFLIATFLSIILITATLGRAWCGWGCPQTVYLEFVYRPIERLIEGREHVRRRRDEGPLTGDKVVRKVVKYTAFLLISLFLAHTFVAYFTSWERLLAWMGSSPLENPGYFVMMACTTALVLFDFAFFREQMCTIICPYARIQSVLVDKDSLLVAYDYNRGEPRGKVQKGKTDELGDCVDCYACVRTCPTGIDIRDGLQMECVACTQCIDACDAIMDKLSRPRGLIRYLTTEELETNKKTSILRRFVRPRVLLYSTILAVLLGTLATLAVTRSDYDVDMNRRSGAAFTMMGDDQISNPLRFRFENRTATPVTFTVTAQDERTTVRFMGPQALEAGAHERVRTDAFVILPKDRFVDGSATEVFEIRVDGQIIEEIPFALLGPSGSP